jgi:nitroreductase
MSNPDHEQNKARLHLPRPRREANSFMHLLSWRRSNRSFLDRELDSQILADLLWAAFGINNRDGYRTAPSAKNWQEIDVYVALVSGLYLFEAPTGDLLEVSRDDLRAATGQQDFVGLAPVNLIYVAEGDRMVGASPEEREYYAAADTGAICQNVYLFCASVGLATVVRGLINRSELAILMKLRHSQRIVLAQTVGYPATSP